MIAILFSPVLKAQLTGAKAIPGDYATVSAAVTALNASGVGAGGVTFNVAAGYTESITAPINITTAGAAGSPIVFQKSGVGANPVITRTDAGSTTTSALGGLGDAVIRIDGTDFLTFDGIDVSASLQGIEYGYFTSKTATNACQNLTIQNCVISMTKGTSGFVIGIHIGNGTVSVSSATGVTVTANSGRSENILIRGNTIQNVHAGIYCRGFNSAALYDQNITIGQAGAGNTIRNFGGGSATTTYGVYFIYANNTSVDYNTIDNAGGGGSAHASIFYSIFYSVVSGVVSGSNNAITVNTSGTSAMQCIYNSNAVTSNTFSNNSFSGSVATTGTSYLIYASSTTPDVTITGNQVSGTFTKTGASGTFYCYYNLGSPAAGTETITNNNFSNITSTGTGAFNGIYTNTAVGQNRVCHSNTISNWTIGSTSTSYGIYCLSSLSNQVYNNTVSNINATASGGLVGIYFTGTNPTVYGNTVSNLTIGNATVFYGMQCAGTGTVNLYGNRIFNLVNNNAASTAANLVAGIHVSTNGTSTNIYNNLIGGLSAPSSISTDAIRGINLAATTASTGIAISYNTIYLNASSSGANFGTSGIYHTTNATAGNGNLVLRNNIVYNGSTAAGTGVVAAYRRSNSTTANYNASSDKNIFYGGPASPSQLIFTDGTVLNQSLGEYQTYMSGVGADQNSYEENVSFLSTSGASADFLKFNTGIPSIAESGAGNIAGITTDYFNTTRQGNPGYAGTGSSPDVGAWELEGTALGGCAGSPAASTAQTSNANPCSGSNFSLTLDVVFGVGHAFQWEESTAGAGGPYTPVGGATSATLTTNTTVSKWYRCIVTCVSSGQSTTSAEVAVSIAAPLSGTYLIDNTGAGNYLSFGDAIADINCKGLGGAVTFQVTAGQAFTESGSLSCVVSGTAVNTVTFQRNGAGANPVILKAGTSGTADFILQLSGVDYYTFDGIDFVQTGGSAADWVEYGVWITNASTTNGAKNNTIKNGTITLSNAHTGARGVFIGSAFTPVSLDGTQSNNRFLNMTVQYAWEAYRITGATTTYMDDANEIGTESGGSSIIQNMGDGITTGSVYGVFATYQTNFKLRNTAVSNLLPGGTSLVYGITMQTSASNSATISDNTFSNISGGGTVYGIYFTSGDTADIYNNEMYGISSSGTSSSVRGIYLTATGLNANVYNNRIYNINANGITTTTVAGIDVGTGLAYNIYNNMVSDIKAPASTQTAAGTRGISITSGSTGGVVKIYNNTVVLSDVATATAYTSAALHNSSTTPTLDIRNNIFINNSDISSAGTRVAAFWKTSTTDNIDNNSNNNLYYAGVADAAHLVYYDGTNAIQTIPAYQGLAAITPGESATLTENTAFVLPVLNGILRPDPVTPTYAEGGAQVLALVPADFENEVRSLSTPDIGADEGNFTVQLPPLPDCANYISPANGATDLCSYGIVSLNWSASLSGGPVSQGYDVYFGTSPAPAFVLNTSATSYSPAGLLPNTTYYWQIVPKNAAGSAVGCAVQSFTTINAQVTGTTGDTRCGTGPVNLSASGAGTFKWYNTASGGTSIATGAVYSPVVSSTTDFWVSASDGGVNSVVGPVSPTSLSGVSSSNIAVTTQYMLFDVLAASATIASLDVYPTAAIGSTFNISIRNSSGTEIFNSGSITTTVTGGATPQTVVLNAVIPAGINYRIGLGVNPGMQRNTLGAVYPYTIPGVISFTGNSFNVTYWYFVYNINVVTGCESPRQMVTATVIPSTTYYTDADGDSYGDPASPVISCTGAPSGAVADNTDCNDANAAVNPAAADVCNGLDDDCDGTTDEGCSALTFYADTDNDSYGNPSSFIVQTNPVPPAGYVADNTDCNDGNASVNPAATELCNNMDDDCDGSIDEGFDADNDGYTSCNGDCDDNNAAVNPLAAEACNGIDDDCNGLTDDNVPAIPSLGAINGTLSACLPGIAGSASFSVAPVATATTYMWTVPAGFSISSGQGSTSITVTWTASAIQAGISGSICVTASNACLSTAASCSAVDYQIAAPVTPPSISGPGKLCPGDNVTYSIAAVARASSYAWSVPATMTITAGQGTNVISVSVNPGYSGGSVSVIAVNVCGSSPARSKAVTLNLPGTPTAIQGQKEGLCNLSGIVFSVPAVPAATSYLWTVNGGTLISGQGTTSITADFGNLTSGTVTVQAVNGCGSSLIRTLTLVGAPARPGTISGPSACAGTSQVYSVATVAQASSYNWVVTAGGSISSGQGTKDVTILWSATPVSNQSLSVTASNACGTSSTRVLSGITVSSCPRTGSLDASVGMEVYPNPASGFTTVQFSAGTAANYRLIITDISGRTVYAESFTAVEGLNRREVSLDALSSGLYGLELEGNAVKKQIRLIVE
ncbi:MAG: hypothetical protein JNL88_00850 [Bacteroidia bacterium]|nr:hypothetical protein [Bacteroidia bacterium]